MKKKEGKKRHWHKGTHQPAVIHLAREENKKRAKLLRLREKQNKCDGLPHIHEGAGQASRKLARSSSRGYHDVTLFSFISPC